MALDIGSGNSCNRGRWASDPSQSAGEGKGKRWNPYMFGSPSNRGSEYLPGMRGRSMIVFPCKPVEVAFFNMCSNVCHGRLIGFFNLRDTSRSTSGVDRVSCSDRMTGGAVAETATFAPDSGVDWTHDSKNEWSGRMRSARTLVSSMKLPKLTMNGICMSVSFTPAAFGDPNTGLALSTNNTSKELNPKESSHPTESSMGVKKMPPGVSTLPINAFSAFTASAVKRPFD